MKQLEKYDTPETLLRHNLQRVGDVINMEGPMLVLFEDKRDNELYLFDWVDGDDKTNRWLIYNVSRTALFSFIHRHISYKKMYELSAKDVFVADIVNADLPFYGIYKLKYVPLEYLPDTDGFFDRTDAVNLSAIISKLSTKTLQPLNNAVDMLSKTPDLVSLTSSYGNRKVEIKDFPPMKANSIGDPYIKIMYLLPQLYSQKDVRKDNRIPKKTKLDIH